MNYFDDEELERALFALPLEEPPADMRAAILAATVYRAPAIMKLWEIAAVAVAAAVVTWLVWQISMGGLPLFTHSLQSIGEIASRFASRSLSNITTLAWIAVGGATTVWLSLWPNAPLGVRERIARR
jgi:hypothetical protein